MFRHLLYHKVGGMGLEGPLLSIGSATFQGMGSRKEVDSGFQTSTGSIWEG